MSWNGSLCERYTGLGLLALALHCNVAANPFIPTDDAQVVERLRERPLDRTDIEFRHARALLRASPTSLPPALTVAQRAIDIARRDGDPRFLGYAQAALEPWWSLPNPPPEVQLTRAIVLQSTHQFPAALADLSAVLRANPRNAQAWLTQASILQVQGRYAEAAASCKAAPATRSGPVRRSVSGRTVQPQRPRSGSRRKP